MIDEPGVHFFFFSLPPPLHRRLGSLQCSEQWVLLLRRLRQNINVPHLLNMCLPLYMDFLSPHGVLAEGRQGREEVFLFIFHGGVPDRALIVCQ